MTLPNTVETDLELRDAIASGLFDPVTGDLYPGFPITADDTVLIADYAGWNEAAFCASRGARVLYVADDARAPTALGERLAGARQVAPVVRGAGPLPLADGTATRIVTTDLIVRAQAPEVLLQELVRAGAPGARYLLVEPDPTAAELRIGLTADSHAASRPAGFIGRREFDRIVTEAGLEIEERGSLGFYQAMRSILAPIHEADAEHGTLLENWAKTWRLVLDTPGSSTVCHALHEALPDRQYLIARKAPNLGRRSRGLSSTLQMIRTMLAGSPGDRTVDHEVRRAKPAVKPSAPAQIGPVPVDDTLDPKWVGFNDAVWNGWFKVDDNGELFPGFPIGPDDVVLDVGCGQGAYSAVCGRKGAHIIAVDMDADNVAETGRRVAETAAKAFTPIVGDVNPLALADAFVTKVISTDVIQYVDDPAIFLRELVRVGRPGARYLLQVPDALQEEIQRQVAPPEFFVKPKPGEGIIRGLSSGHLRTISRDEFERMVTAAGLVVESVHLTSFYWALWFAFFWMCNVDFGDPRHPLLIQWARTWKIVLDAPDGLKVKARVDNFMPNSQVIIAWKP